MSVKGPEIGRIVTEVQSLDVRGCIECEGDKLYKNELPGDS